MFSGDIERDQWYDMCQTNNFENVFGVMEKLGYHMFSNEKFHVINKFLFDLNVLLKKLSRQCHLL